MLSLAAGVWADRASPKKIIRVGEMVRTLGLASLAFMTASGMLTLPLLVVCCFLFTIGAVTNAVAVPSLIFVVLAKDSFAASNGRVELVRSLAYVGGPALTGALLGGAEPWSAFLVAAIFSAIALGFMFHLQQPATTVKIERHIFRDAYDGAIFCFKHASLRSILSVSIIFNIAFFTLQAAYVPYAMKSLKFSPEMISLTVVAYGIGMVIGAAMAVKISALFSSKNVFLIGPLSGLLAAVMLLSTLWFPSFYSALLCFMLFGFGPIIWTVSTTTFRQHVTPPDLIARVSAINTMAAYGSRPIGAAIGGVTGSCFGVQFCLWLAVAVFALQLGLTLKSPLTAPTQVHGKA